MQAQEATLHLKEWRLARGVSQQDLADVIHRDKSVVSKMERGLSSISEVQLRSIASFIGVHPAALFEPPPPGTGPLNDEITGQAGGLAVGQRQFLPENLVSDRADLPIYASAAGGSTGLIMQYDPIDWVKRPEPLFNVSSGFGMYVVGDSMEPAYKQGDMILIHPKRPPNKGDDVLVVKTNGNGDHEALVKTLVGSYPDDLILKQHNPAKEFTLDPKDVQGVYLIVGKYNRR